MKESVIQKISRKTGRKPSECKCEKCREQCRRSVCLGTPADIEKIIDAGLGDLIFDTVWGAGMALGVHSAPVRMYQAEYDTSKGSCTFFENGLCKLHDLGLKPTEGKLSYHTITAENYGKGGGLTWQVAKEWLAPANADTIKRIEEKLGR